MNRITERLAALKESGTKALVAYIVNGDPRQDITVSAMQALVEAGADIIELGVPFSDPMAEGPVIQRAHERALDAGASLKSTLDIVAQFRQTDSNTPVVLMGYANPVERMGYEKFAEEAVKAGVDGLLTVDLPPEESEALTGILHQANIETISLIAPTTTDDRIAKITQLSSGFLYYVSVKGVTGSGNLDGEAVKSKVELIRSHSDLPVLVGFGIKDAASATLVGQHADGVIVGSVLVNAMAETADASDATTKQKLIDVLAPIRQALNELTD